VTLVHGPRATGGRHPPRDHDPGAPRRASTPMPGRQGRHRGTPPPASAAPRWCQRTSVALLEPCRRPRPQGPATAAGRDTS
jgi:hypothetical protein